MSPAPPDRPFSDPPPWPHCGHGSTPEDPIGCRGVHVSGRSVCLAHLDDADRAIHLGTLGPGAEIDCRGTRFTQNLLRQLLNSLRDPASLELRIGAASFHGASFTGPADFGRAAFIGYVSFAEASFFDTAEFYGVTFADTALFGGASFAGHAGFDGASFSGAAGFSGVSFSQGGGFSGGSFAGPVSFSLASVTGHLRFAGVTFSESVDFYSASFSGVDFGGVTFADDAGFGEVTFSGDATFVDTTFSGAANFRQSTFDGDAWFAKAVFSRAASFALTTFTRDAGFDKASFLGPADFFKATFSSVVWFGGASFAGNVKFEAACFAVAPRLGPLACGGTINLNSAVFRAPVTVEMAARTITCLRTRWESTASLHLRHAELDLVDAVFEHPVKVAGRPSPFPSFDEPLRRVGLLDQDPNVHLMSVSGVDAAHLALHDIDLSRCQFAGAVHLDQLRVDGWCTFAKTPTGTQWRRLPLRWWSVRRTLLEEHHWRVRTARRISWTRGWAAPPEDTTVLRAASLAALYRQLRKSLEDGKNEPGAADFYYGECEMRRHDRDDTPFVERALLTVYWALSGYGLRAARALCWLLAAMAVTLVALVIWGLPTDAPKPQLNGRQSGSDITLTTTTPDPVNPEGPWSHRMTGERFEKSLRVVINSVVFRSSGQDLTTTGTYTEMASRLAEPVLLGLVALAVRNRVKR
jgi:uncharacterized protein YjbI with pentapeptide repeats